MLSYVWASLNWPDRGCRIDIRELQYRLKLGKLFTPKYQINNDYKAKQLEKTIISFSEVFFVGDVVIFSF